MSIIHNAWLTAGGPHKEVVYIPCVDSFYEAHRTSRDPSTKRRHVMVGDLRIINPNKGTVRVKGLFGQTVDQDIQDIDERIIEDHRICASQIKNADAIRQASKTPTSQIKTVPDGATLPLMCLQTPTA